MLDYGPREKDGKTYYTYELLSRTGGSIASAFLDCRQVLNYNFLYRYTPVLPYRTMLVVVVESVEKCPHIR